MRAEGRLLQLSLRVRDGEASGLRSGALRQETSQPSHFPVAGTCLSLTSPRFRTCETGGDQSSAEGLRGPRRLKRREQGRDGGEEEDSTPARGSRRRVSSGRGQEFQRQR